jgi:ABC-type cobalamin/Fe3+-siderophores transport system ATPase subunit
VCVRYYTDFIPQERTIPPEQELVPPPVGGSIEFRQYSMRYRDGLPLVLDRVTFQVRKGEKIGVCGRTGAGTTEVWESKQSRIALSTCLMCRQIEFAFGAVSIGGGCGGLHHCGWAGHQPHQCVPACSLFSILFHSGLIGFAFGWVAVCADQEKLRSSLGIIPQVHPPFSFVLCARSFVVMCCAVPCCRILCCTLVRFGPISTRSMRTATLRCCTHSTVRTCAQPSTRSKKGWKRRCSKTARTFRSGRGVSCVWPVRCCATPTSSFWYAHILVGLFLSLAIFFDFVVLFVAKDEATASVDLATDEQIQATIRSDFAHCTTLTIAHRIHTVIDCDRILVMSDGRVVEFDEPHVLLCDPQSVFSGMVKETGAASAALLREMALKASQQRRRGTATASIPAHNHTNISGPDSSSSSTSIDVKIQS